MGPAYQGVQAMDERKASEVARRYVAYIKEKHPDIKKVYLFGSCAKGGFGADSDIDLAIIFENLSDTFEMQVQLMKLRRKFDTRIEPHPFRESDFDFSNPLVREILTTGREVA